MNRIKQQAAFSSDNPTRVVHLPAFIQGDWPTTLFINEDQEVIVNLEMNLQGQCTRQLVRIEAQGQTVGIRP